MSTENKISLPVIRRLPRYYRYIEDLVKNGVERISSSELAHMMGSTASQVRQDFNCFGGFGQQGIGYNTTLLRDELAKLIFQDNTLSAVLIGVGSLGHTVAKYISDKTKGVSLIGAFDVKESLIGKKVENVDVLSLDKLSAFCKEHNPQIAVMCIPTEAAQNIADEIGALGFKGVWNFSHYDFSLHNKDLIVENVHLQDSMMSLEFRINNNL